MILDRLVLRDVFAYRHVDLDLRSLGSGVFAIVGENGAGKTGLLEAVPAVAYLKLPARENDHPVHYATSREAAVEVAYTLDAGHYRAVLSLDAQSGGSDGLLQQIDADGRRLQDLNDGKVSTLKAAIAAHVPSYDLFLNSVFAAQGRGDEFTRAKASARKELFAELLALHGLLDKAQTARDAAALIDQARARLQAARVALQASLTPETFGQQEAGHHADIAIAEQMQRDLDGRIATIEAQLATMGDAVAAHGAATLRLRTVEDRLRERKAERGAIHTARITAGETFSRQQQAIAREAEQAVAEIDRRIENNTALQAKAGEIRAAAALIEEHDAALAEARPLLDLARQDERDARARLRTAEQQLAALGPVQARHDRAEADAARLETVPCHGEGAYAGCELLTAAQAARAELATLAAQLAPRAALADTVGQATRDAERASAAVHAAEQTITALETAKRGHAELASRLAKLEASEERVKELLADRARTLDQREARLQEAKAAHEAADEQRAAQWHALDDQIATLEAERAEAAAALNAVTSVHQEAAGLQAALTEARTGRERAVATVATATAGLEAIAQARQARARSEAQIATLDGQIARLDQELVEWRELEQALGKTGLVALELDAAGPSVTALANALLLEGCDGAFSIELVTQIEKADGSGHKEGFAVRVHDNVRGGWRELRQLSGGQRTLVQEALMLAIALYVNERSTHPIRTLWRDETGAALDEAHAVRYVAMLRKVRELGGFHAVLFISHNAAASALADAQIQVGGGSARIVLPPFAREVAA